MAETSTRIDGEMIADCVARFRARRPHVHCITNNVAQNFTANVLLAAGATPSMTIAIEEITAFVDMADALLINLGTMDNERSKAIKLAVDTAKRSETPWALDPVFVQASPVRLELAQELLSKKPTLVRCNTGEGSALFGEAMTDENLPKLAGKHSTTITVTGKTDRVSDGLTTLYLGNGAPIMERITAMGCALNALMAGFAAIEPSRILASASAVSLYGICGERAAQASGGPGTFLPHFLDALAMTAPADLAREVKLL